MSRRLLRYAAPALLVLAIGAYAASLVQAHAAVVHVRDQIAFVQRLGSDASAGSSGRDDGDGGLRLASPDDRPVEALWRLAPPDEGRAAGTRFEDLAVFVAGVDLRFSRPDGYAALSLDGVPIGVVRPRLRDFGGAAHVGPGLGTQMIDVPPGVRPGFLFPVSPSAAAGGRPHAVGITLAGANWVIDGVGLRATTLPPVAPALWPDGVPAWPAAAAGLGLAALSHAVLSALRPKAVVAPKRHPEPR